MADYYDRDGSPMTLDQWASSFEDRQEKKRVAEDTVGGYWVSTVWLGLNHAFGNGAPLIFETMVFPQENGEITSWLEEYGDRYSTEEQALAGHARVVESLREGMSLASIAESRPE